MSSCLSRISRIHVPPALRRRRRSLVRPVLLEPVGRDVEGLEPVVLPREPARRPQKRSRRWGTARDARSPRWGRRAAARASSAAAPADASAVGCVRGRRWTTKPRARSVAVASRLPGRTRRSDVSPGRGARSIRRAVTRARAEGRRVDARASRRAAAAARGAPRTRHRARINPTRRAPG